jgi:arginine-tRNA-protein transferase
MQTAFHFLAPPGPCSYLPDETWTLEYEDFVALNAAEYQERLLAGWRRFGHSVFRPRCETCRACRSLRVDVRRFRPNRSQRRVRKLNEDQVRLEIGTPRITRSRLELFQRYHAHQADFKGWPRHRPRDADSYRASFVHNPFRTEEWCYYLAERLIGVGYVDALPAGLSAIYFYYEPALRERSLGIWNVLSVLEQAEARGLPHVYLGYFVAGCRSMEYKAGFVPNEVLGDDGRWRAFRV